MSEKRNVNSGKIRAGRMLTVHDCLFVYYLGFWVDDCESLLTDGDPHNVWEILL